ncbi:MFS transporter [Actinobacillus porcinus]|uniref:MFS transporter n=1 Tax=Actinobacillus porcinus TaxID=51048 RepID=UPI002354583B|nr:MFS transporter [Actinobacillus porcinus]MCI5763849.1 MFS transporter [Actinobacillus porcinus]MDY5422287.1 MFS transporter [Actinobacillus porcinus]
MLSPSHSEQKANTVAFAFLLIAFLTGIASSFQTPTLSLFLSQEIQVSPFMVGLFYAFNALMGIVLSQILARYSDKLDERRKIIIVCCMIAMIGCLVFAYSRNYYVLAFLGTFLLGIGAASNPQSFALAREYAENSGREAVMFTTIMRTQISLAWIVGPPLSFSIAMSWGFDYMYLIAASAFLLCALISALLLPKTPMRHSVKNATKEMSHQIDKKSVFYLFMTCFLVMGSNGMYLINMPLYIIHELNLPERLAGILMGTAAGMEIPIMLIAGYLTQYFSKRTLIFTALLAGILFFIALPLTTKTWQLMSLQLLNAIIIGIVATIGMVYFQDLMPTQMGSATTLFSNAAKSSWIASGPVAGIIAQHWHYGSVFYVSIGALIIATLCFTKVKSV